jgi:small conductance mechanosensitive channel
MDILKKNPDLFKLKFKDKKSMIARGFSLLVGFVVIIIAHIFATVVKKYIYKLGEHIEPPERKPGEVEMSETQATTQVKKTLILYVIIGHLTYYFIMIISIMMVFKYIGLETTGLLAIIGAAGFAIGLALQGSLSDIAAGILIALFQIYTIGEIIDYNGQMGRVKDFTMFHTILLDIPTNTTITIPNRKIQEGPIKNLTRQKVHYAVADILVSNKNNDFKFIMDTIAEAANKNPYKLKDKKVQVMMIDLSNGGTTIRAKVPISSSFIIEGTASVKLQIREALAKNNIQMIDCRD